MSCLSMPWISRRTLSASGRRARITAQLGEAPDTTTFPASRTSLIVPMRRPHSVRSITAMSAGCSRLTIRLSSTHWKSAP